MTGDFRLLGRFRLPRALSLFRQRGEKNLKGVAGNLWGRPNKGVRRRGKVTDEEQSAGHGYVQEE
ncbi:MAG: hypothetical protein ACREJJ_00680 [Candidatus Methylomirabilales bacterium]